MHVLVLCHELPPVGGGAATVCAALAEEYAAAGCRVTVATMGWGGLPAEEVTEDGVAVVRLPCGRRRREGASPAEAAHWAGRAVAWARRRHRRAPFDAVHAHFVLPAGLAAVLLAGRGTRLPFVLTAHGSDVPGYDPSRFPWIHRLVAPTWRRVCAAAAVLVSPSRSLQRLLAAAGVRRPTRVIPNPVDADRFTPASKQPRILLASRLVERKCFHVLLEALRGVELPGWEVDVVGDGPERPRLERLAGDLAIPVRFHGWIGRDDPRLARLFGRAGLFVFPSRWENLPLAPLEAMAAGCAVVATDVEGVIEAVGDAARRVPVGDRRALAAAVRELAADEAARHDLGRRGRRRVESLFARPAVAARYLAELEAAAATAGPRA